jgi:hypothetical protein
MQVHHGGALTPAATAIPRHRPGAGAARRLALGRKQYTHAATIARSTSPTDTGLSVGEGLARVAEQRQRARQLHLPALEPWPAGARRRFPATVRAAASSRQRRRTSTSARTVARGWVRIVGWLHGGQAERDAAG